MADESEVNASLAAGRVHGVEAMAGSLAEILHQLERLAVHEKCDSALQDARYVIDTITFFAYPCPENSAFLKVFSEKSAKLRGNLM